MNNTRNITFKCPFCSMKFTKKSSLYSHMESEHEEQLEGLSPAQTYFNIKYHKTHGECIICKQHTKFDEKKERYERLCDNPRCKERYRKQFVENMTKRYGKETLLNDPKQQEKMLANRKISGTYVWSTNKKHKFTYTGTYEKEFLEFMDIFLHWNPEDLLSPCPVIFNYKYENKKHFYIPDFYVPSLNLIVEIKAYTNNHYRQRDIEIEKIKDEVVKKSKFNYIKVHDKYYDDFYKELFKLIGELKSSNSIM